jgi:thioredoxin 1
MYQTLLTIEQLHCEIFTNKAMLVYYSHQFCNVCKVLKPKIAELVTERFPDIGLFYCNTIDSPELAAQSNIFAVPAIVVYFDNKEFFRKSRNLGIGELAEMLERPYKLLFHR